ncbi:N-glycosylase/DNA lyase [Halomicrobium urmianum]|uniref:N-glycosylase/DNA lyase n=1 Tax=Halomicrobium urmianum TaxID=1586233 RepID=UPI0027E4A793|nr:N-glycosylase/DNA lyase [Halomicrobium urmianum]
MTDSRTLNQKRIDAVADAMVDLGYDGITRFDRVEPEYRVLMTIRESYDANDHVYLLGVCAGIVDYQLLGDAQRFWAALEEVTLEHDQVDSIDDVQAILGAFMDASVNQRLNQQKRLRLSKLFEGSFAEWFVENHTTVPPVRIWEELATALDNQMHKKTIVFAMKVYDILSLVETGEYASFPTDIPIPCDLQVERVAGTAGLVETDDSDVVIDAWAAVADAVNEELETPVSLLRIDSIVWQAGQIIGESDQASARRKLVDHFKELGIEREQADSLAAELTVER